MQVYAEYGLPPFISAAINVGFKPKKPEPEVDFEDFMRGLAPGGTY